MATEESRTTSSAAGTARPSQRRISWGFLAVGVTLLLIFGLLVGAAVLGGRPRTHDTLVALGILPGAPLTAAEAKKAVASVRPILIDGVAAPEDWVHVNADGSLVATGFAFEPGSQSSVEASGHTLSATYNLLLIVPARAGTLPFAQVLPITLTDRTPVTLGSTPISFSSLPNTLLLDEHPMTVSFPIVGRSLVAKRVSISQRSAEPSAGAYKPTTSLDVPDAPGLEVAHLITQEPSPWLSLRSDGTPSLLTGDMGGSGWQETPKQGMRAQVDVLAPDHLASAPLYHAVVVWYPSEATMLTALAKGGASSERRGVKIPVRQSGSVLVGVTK